MAKINVAFFQMNALVGLILVIGVGVSLLPQTIVFGVNRVENGQHVNHTWEIGGQP